MRKGVEVLVMSCIFALFGLGVLILVPMFRSVPWGEPGIMGKWNVGSNVYCLVYWEDVLLCFHNVLGVRREWVCLGQVQGADLQVTRVLGSGDGSLLAVASEKVSVGGGSELVRHCLDLKTGQVFAYRFTGDQRSDEEDRDRDRSVKTMLKQRGGLVELGRGLKMDCSFDVGRVNRKVWKMMKSDIESRERGEIRAPIVWMDDDLRVRWRNIERSGAQ